MPTILIVDDSASIRAFLAQALQSHGHQVTVTADGKAALAQLQLQRFDAIITDIYMPEVDGLELIKHCRAAGLLSRVIAISSAEADVDLLPVARVLGAARTLRKPFAASELLKAVDWVLRHPARLPGAHLPRRMAAHPRPSR